MDTGLVGPRIVVALVVDTGLAPVVEMMVDTGIAAPLPDSFPEAALESDTLVDMAGTVVPAVAAGNKSVGEAVDLSLKTRPECPFQLLLL